MGQGTRGSDQTQRRAASQSFPQLSFLFSRLTGSTEDRQRILGWVYLTLATPTLFLLSIITQPLHAVDEPAHFLRITQLAQGSIRPILGPDQRSTGSYQKEGTRLFSSYYGLSFRNYQHGSSKTSLFELRKLAAIRSGGNPGYVSHSNTTVYFPLAYAAPLIGVSGAMWLTDRPLLWMYAGRLVTALCGMGIAFAAIRGARRSGWFLFVMALLPITLFVMASLSADSLLLPMSMLLAQRVARVADGETLSGPGLLTAIIAAAFVGLGKIAYLPLITILPVAAFLRSQRLDRQTGSFLISCVLICCISFAWDNAIRGLVFTVNQGAFKDNIDVERQLSLVLHQPSTFVAAFFRSFTPPLIWEYARSLLGTLIGWLDVGFPKAFVFSNAAALIVASFFDRPQATPLPMLRWYVILISTACVIAVFLFLYLQWNPVGATFVQGVQGRYFLPLAPLLAVVIPTKPLSSRELRVIAVMLIAWGCSSVAATLLLDFRRYWGLI